MKAKTQQSKTPKQSKAKPEPVKQAEPVEQARINFDTAVTEAKGHIWSKEFHETKIGELADRLEPKYGAQTLAKFAEAIGLAYETVKKYRTVFRKYKDTPIGETSTSFAVKSSLAAVPEAADIIMAKPEMTTPEARGIASAHRSSTKKAKPFKTRDEPGWLRDAVADALKARTKYGRAKPEDFDPEVLRVVFPNLGKAVASLREGENTYRLVADLMEAAAAKPDSAAPTHHEPMFEDAKPVPEAAE